MNEDLKHYYIKFQKHIENFEKESALEYSMMLLSQGKITVPELYEDILSPSLNSIVIDRGEENQRIWKEHLMTGIARTIIECSYPYVLKERDKNKEAYITKKVMVLCPEEEYHEIGARMGADFFTITNCEVFFIGCNTPKENFISAFNTLKPDIIAISVTNYLNLFPLKTIIAQIKENSGNKVIIAVSGSAFKHSLKTAEDFCADVYINTFEDICALRRNNHEFTI